MIVCSKTYHIIEKLSGYIPSFGAKNAAPQPATQNQAITTENKITTTSGRTNWASKYPK